MTRVREAVRADGAALGEAEADAEDFADVAAPAPVGEVDGELQAAWDEEDLPRRDAQHAALRPRDEGPLLRHDEHVAVGVREAAVAHVGAGGVEVHGVARTARGVAQAAEGVHAVEKVDLPPRDRQGLPADAVRIERAERAREAPLRQAHELSVESRRSDLVKPEARVLRAARREWHAAHELRVQAVGRLSRRVLRARERAGEGLRFHRPAEAACGSGGVASSPLGRGALLRVVTRHGFVLQGFWLDAPERSAARSFAARTVASGRCDANPTAVSLWSSERRSRGACP